MQTNRSDIKKVCLLGSGGLSIGQAGEFDYSGTQAVNALLNQGLEVVLINPNIATVQTNPRPNVQVYLYPVTPEWVERVLEKERPQGIIGGFGGQTGLNCLIQLEQRGVLDRLGIVNFGTPVDAVRITEDRDLFALKMKELDIPIPPSIACNTVHEACNAAQEISYPVIVRAAYALGGLGSGFASNEDQLRKLVEPALMVSPQVLVEKSLKGWKEVEYEVMRDGDGNVITICNMENFDPLGVHTGDSIVVTPSQSLNDEEYQKLRNASLHIVGNLGVIGECNAQYALDPESSNYYIIEVNARLSRSSALASKASGYPIAYIAAHVVMGHSLPELTNPVTGTTSAFYEPALDYVTIKVPRWDLSKFRGTSRDLGSTMKSVGEIMAIGRDFCEALQKAVRMITEDERGILAGSCLALGEAVAWEDLDQPTDSRLFGLLGAMRAGRSVDNLHEITKIDPWFLSQLARIIRAENDLRDLQQEAGTVDAAVDQLNSLQLSLYKRHGFSDVQIAGLLLGQESASSEHIYDIAARVRKRRKEFGIRPFVKKIDTTSSEYPCPSNYLYLTYHAQFDDRLENDGKSAVLVLGGGAYRIGASVEFDWCAVSCSKTLQQAGRRSVMINCNPETVSTDFNCSDRLYFEELSLERILDIADLEKAKDVVVSMGGQLPNRLALPLSRAGMHLLGHSAEAVDGAEDRNKFSALCDRLQLDQPKWISASSLSAVKSFVEKVGFPVLIRPSYVLSGAAMKVAYDQDSLERFLGQADEISSEHPVVVSVFYSGAREVEVDGVAINGRIVTHIVSEHIENAGIHSGDATTVVPPQRLYVETVRRVKHASKTIAAGLNLNGPFNIQFLARNNMVKVIETNVRAARSFPFISKVVGVDLAAAATQVMLGKTPKIARFQEDELPHVGVKAAMFSFTRLKGADPVTGVEMSSTGEVGCISRSFDAAMLLAMRATHVHRPRVGVLVSAGPEQMKMRFLESAEIIRQMGIPIYATAGTAKFLDKHGIEAISVPWPGEGPDDVIQLITSRKVDFVCNIPKSHKEKELTRGSSIRQMAVQCGVSLLTDLEKMIAYFRALAAYPEESHEPQPEVLPAYHEMS